jgi:hypothetical protein
MKAISKFLICTTASAAFVALSAVSASAAIACSGNVCWHSHERYHYPRASHVVVHADTWRHGPSISIREHEGRGYWHGDSWKSW